MSARRKKAASIRTKKTARTKTARTKTAPAKKAPAKKAAANTVPKRRATDTDSGLFGERWELRLYVAGRSARSLMAFSNLKKICEEHLRNRYSIEVVDLLERPQLAHGDQIIALPTLVRKLPEPIRKIVGDLSDTEKTLVGLQLRPRRA